MSGSKGWIGNTDRDRIRGLMARSANVIATAREDLDKSSADLEHLSGASEPGASKRRSRRPMLTRSSLPQSKGPVSRVPVSETLLSKTPGPKFPETQSTEAPKLPNPQSPQPRAPLAQGASLEARLFLEPLPPLEAKLPLESKPSLEPNGSLEPVNNGQAASGRRRALFRRFLQTRDLKDVRALQQFQREDAEDAEVEDAEADSIETGKQGKDRSDGAKGLMSRFRKRRALARSTSRDTETFDTHTRDRDGLDRNNLNRDGSDRDGLDRAAPWKDARFTHQPWEWRGAEPEPERHSKLSIFLSWNQRLDALTNAVAGVLILALLGSWTVGAGAPVRSEPLVERAEADVTRAPLPKNDPVAALIANAGLTQSGDQRETTAPGATALLASASGFRLLANAFPEPLPAMAQDISMMHRWARPSLVSAPGLSVLPYTGLPQAIPAVPPDIAAHILITTPQ